jgi:hypothetical protein
VSFNPFAKEKSLSRIHVRFRMTSLASCLQIRIQKYLENAFTHSLHAENFSSHLITGIVGRIQIVVCEMESVKNCVWNKGMSGWM